MKAVKAKCKIWKRKQFQLFTFYKPACSQKYFHGQVLSIRVFSSDGHYGLIVSLRGWTLSRHVINLNRVFIQHPNMVKLEQNPGYSARPAVVIWPYLGICTARAVVKWRSRFLAKSVYLQDVEELSSRPRNSNPSCDREEDLNLGPPDY